MLFDENSSIQSYSQEARSIKDGVMPEIEKLIDSGVYLNGKNVEELEQDLSAYYHFESCAAVSSGTDALILMMRALGIGSGDTVLTTASTFVAAVEAILAVGATPQFVDIDEDCWQMPMVDFPQGYILVPHLYGYGSLAVHSKCKGVLEDASQSIGGLLSNKQLGSLGVCAAISCHPTKNLSAFGDAGFVTSTNTELVEKVKALRNHGQKKFKVHSFSGTTARIDEFQALVLKHKLRNVQDYIEEKKKIAEEYRAAFDSLDVRLPIVHPSLTPAPSLFVIRVENRDKFQNHMSKNDIETGIHYPTPIHMMDAYRQEEWAHVSLPETEKLSMEIVSLPLWYGMKQEHTNKVIDVVRSYFR